MLYIGYILPSSTINDNISIFLSIVVLNVAVNLLANCLISVLSIYVRY